MKAKEKKLNDQITLDEHRLWVIFHQTYDLITRCEDDLVTKVAGITNQQYLVLWIMVFMKDVLDSPIIITDLAPSLYRSVNSISSIINRMQKLGLIKKVRNLPDKRAVRLKMTPKGEEAFKAALRPTRELVKGMFSAFSEEEIKTLLSLLKKLKSQVGEQYKIDQVKIDPELTNPQKIVQFLSKGNF
jgi:DNA-binding MarR family transcriptional regulator